LTFAGAVVAVVAQRAHRTADRRDSGGAHVDGVAVAQDQLV